MIDRARLISALRRAGALQAVDRARYAARRWSHRRSNRRLRHEHPDFPVPPPHLLFDAIAQVDLYGYRESGLRHAAHIAALIDRACEPGPLAVLEWGCGPGRLIRHMPGLLAARPATVTGTDHNPESVRWCGEHLPGITVVRNGMSPPLPFPDGSFDAAYCVSVFTHLSERVQLEWAEELRRVLRPGGVLVCTTQGEAYRRLLADASERARFDAGEVVVQGGVSEGRKWFLAIHPERFVRERLLAGFAGVRRVPAPAEYGFTQDMWVAFRDRVPDRWAEGAAPD